MLHLIIFKVGSLPHVGKTVLWKLMYFSDFDFYEIFEKYMTGEEYRKLEHGPAPSHFDIAIANLIEGEKIRQIKNKFHGHVQEKYIPIQDPDTSELSKEEVEVINKVISRYGEFNASQISGLSHNDMPWMATDDKKIIDYELVFYRDSVTSVRKYDDDCNN